jgi:hypothetical protein
MASPPTATQISFTTAIDQGATFDATFLGTKSPVNQLK